jgi:hypothetical protein
MGRSLAISNYETEKAHILNAEFQSISVPSIEHIKVVNARDVAFSKVKF